MYIIHISGSVRSSLPPVSIVIVANTSVSLSVNKEKESYNVEANATAADVAVVVCYPSSLFVVPSRLSH